MTKAGLGQETRRGQGVCVKDCTSEYFIEKKAAGYMCLILACGRQTQEDCELEVTLVCKARGQSRLKKK